MFEWFTQRAIEVTVRAQQEARDLGHPFVGSEHILLGLIGLEGGVAFNTLQKFNVELDAIREELLRSSARGLPLPDELLPFTPRAKRALELSWDEARQLHHNYIGTEHLLVGLAREGGGYCPRILKAQGVDLADLQLAVWETLLEWYLAQATRAESGAHDFGCAGILLCRLGRLSDADRHFARALLLPGGESFGSEALACRATINERTQT
ncbi:MAG: hypothetical protein IPM93_13470 [Candidatus Obscuribacter sp.]|nr:hypothetical protein [Candidatus Obscuribacter sp.]